LCDAAATIFIADSLIKPALERRSGFAFADESLGFLLLAISLSAFSPLALYTFGFWRWLVALALRTRLFSALGFFAVAFRAQLSRTWILSASSRSDSDTSSPIQAGFGISMNRAACRCDQQNSHTLSVLQILRNYKTFFGL
jgi:hypothetical protein